MIANNHQHTPFNKVSSITDGDYNFTFQYNSNHERVKMEVENNNEVVMTKYYFGPTEIQETSEGTRTINHIGIGSGLLAMHVTHPDGSTEIIQCFTDRLGSPIVLANKNGHEIGRYSYTPWGKQRDPYTLQASNTDAIGYRDQPVKWFHRGYTGHEMLYGIGIINMNGRIYDPHTHQFLSPDNYIQSPGFSQSFNRFAYCWNNPLVYTAPSGDLFLGTFLTFVGDALKTAFIDGGLDPTSKTARQNAWRDFDPTAEWSPTNKAWKIDIGGFKTDPNRTVAGRGLQLFSRYTSELPQTLLGKGASHSRNWLGQVDNVEYYRGTTLVNDDAPSYRGAWGFTLGPYINSKNIVADPNVSEIFRHEYGHTLQSRLVGPLYLTRVGLPSLIGQGLDNRGLNDHNREWYETQANRMSYRYFSNHDSGALSTLTWDEHDYPKEYNPNWYWIFAHPPLVFMWWLFF